MKPGMFRSWGELVWFGLTMIVVIGYAWLMVSVVVR